MPETLIGLLYAALLGAALGSFANVLILRWHEDASLLGRSSCPHCKKVIRARHLVPVLSWLLLRGRCAECERKIHIQYPIVEGAAALLGVVAALRWPPFDFQAAPMFWFEFLFTIALLVPAVMDIRWQELPVEFLIGTGAAGFLFRLFTATPDARFSLLMSTLLGLAVVALFFGSQVVVSRGKWLGMGDVWFGLMMAAALGWPKLLVAIYAAYILGGIVAIVGLFTGRLTRRQRIAFGPLLATGVIITLWFGDAVLAWATRAYA